MRAETKTSIGIFLCILIAGVSLYAYIHTQNILVELRIEIPRYQAEIKEIQEENTRLRYAIRTFEGPEHLMELARKPEFGHLKYPLASEILFIPIPQDSDLAK